MPVYEYAGMRSGDGKRVRGVLDADSERAARSLLRQQDIFPTELVAKGARASVPARRARAPRARGPTLDERIAFTRLLASLVGAGIPLVEALREVEQQISGRLARLVPQLRSGVSEGAALSDAMARMPQAFPPSYTHLVRAGEASGALGTVLDRLAASLEAERRVRDQLSSAMVYPCIMAVTGVLILAFLLAVVVPKILVVFQDSHQALPWPTRAMLAASDYVARWGAVTSLSVLAGLAVLVPWARSPRGRMRIERILFAVPGLRTFLVRVVTLRVARTLALLLRNGVPALDGLRMVAETTGFALVREDLQRSARLVDQGASLSDALQPSRTLSPLALHMVRAGEAAGSLEDMLDRVTETFEYEVQRTVERGISLINPAIVLAMGAVVAFIALAALLPVFEMNQLIR